MASKFEYADSSTREPMTMQVSEESSWAMVKAVRLFCHLEQAETFYELLLQ
jgi:hypothetical protein